MFRAILSLILSDIIAHHQELLNCNCSFWFTHVCRCRPLSWLSGNSATTAVGNNKR